MSTARMSKPIFHMSYISAYGLIGSRHYVPPRAAWTGVTPGVTPTPNTTTMNPVELPAQNITRKARSDSRPIAHTSGSHRRNKSSADNYYEDVDPRFAAQEQSRDTIRQNPNIQSSSAVPSSLMPGLSNIPSDLPQPVHSAIETVDPSSSYESIHDGHRSPASDNSNMTSISQRRVNPNWRPPPDGGNYRVGQANLIPPGRRQQHQQRDMLLNTNPDFEIAGVREARVPPAMGGQQGQAF